MNNSTDYIKIENIYKKFTNKPLISITNGKHGSIFVKEKRSFKCPVFLTKTIDTTGCGDAYFAITSAASIGKLDSKLIPFVGNVYAGIYSQFIGNEKIIDKVYSDCVLKLNIDNLASLEKNINFLKDNKEKVNKLIENGSDLYHQIFDENKMESKISKMIIEYANLQKLWN